MLGKDPDDRTERMKTPPALQPLMDDGIIDEVIRSLKSGKEATVYIVRSGSDYRCAKVYRDMAQRSFQQRSQYQEGRKVRGSRQTRARPRKAPGKTQKLQRCISSLMPTCAYPAPMDTSMAFS